MIRASDGVTAPACSPEQDHVHADALTADRTRPAAPETRVLSARDRGPGRDGSGAARAPDGQPFDLVAYAREHGYRVRNLHDGEPVPPSRRPADHDAPAFRGAEDRDDAIIGKDGYVDYGGFGPDRIGWCALCRSRRALNVRLTLLQDAGATIVQKGDTEAAGYAPLARIDDVLAALRAYRRREHVVGAGAPERQTTQPTVVD